MPLDILKQMTGSRGVPENTLLKGTPRSSGSGDTFNSLGNRRGVGDIVLL